MASRGSLLEQLAELSQAAHALAAPMARAIALTTLAALGLSGAPFHEPFRADGRQRSATVTQCSYQNPPQRRRNLTTQSNRTGHSACPPVCRVLV